MAGPIRTYPGKSYFNDSIGIGVIPHESLTVNGSISSNGEIAGNTIVGNWRGNILSSGQAEVEGVDIMSTGLSAGLFLKTTGDGKATWDAIDDEITFDNNNVNGDLIVRGDIIEYAAGGVVFTKTSVFTGPLTTGANTLETFDKDKFKTAKYVVTLSNETPLSTAFEILVTHDGVSVADGTTYGIVDAQATSLLSEVTASVGSAINLIITVTADCTATVYGVAHY
jgi:hypothetical protein|tara:strand:+ start:2049 stop:2723 length:675 start_codon:yes stop_codon:yes gene_type:complete